MHKAKQMNRSLGAINMKHHRSPLPAAIVLVALVTASRLLAATSYTWSGASGTDLFWPTPGNWSPAGPPGSNDDANFFDLGTTNALGQMSSIATANRTIHALRLGQ